jgi:hypothetical protein
MMDIKVDLLQRVKAILLEPDTEWGIIEREPGGVRDLFMNYVAFLAAIPAIAGFIGTSIIGVSVPNLGMLRMPAFAGLLNAFACYVLSFAIVYVIALAANLLAPRFGGQKSFSNALKLAVYSHTPVWVSGVFLLIPGLRFLTILGLYGFYLLWKGLPPLMKTPQERALGFAAALVGCALVVTIVVTMMMSALFPLPRAV